MILPGQMESSAAVLIGFTTGEKDRDGE